MDADFLISLLKSARDAGFLPLVWGVGILLAINRFPWIKSFLMTPIKQTRKNDSDYVKRLDCHIAMDKIDEEFKQLHEKANKTNEKLDTLIGYIKGKLEP